MAQSIFIKETPGDLSKIHLPALRCKRETRKNREAKSDQPFLPGLPEENRKNILAGGENQGFRNVTPGIAQKGAQDFTCPLLGEGKVFAEQGATGHLLLHESRLS